VSILKANKCGHVADDVTIGMDGRSKPQLKIGRDIPKPDEIKRMIDAAAPKPRMHALLLVAALCGLRASELRGLSWGDIDFNAEELHVSQRADRKNKLGAPKTNQSKRTIPLASETLQALRTWKMKSEYKRDHDPVFPTSTGKIEHHKNMLRSLGPVMKEARLMKGSKPKYGLHALRHFFASWCINPEERGGRQLPAKVAQQWLGHSSIVMTLDIYGHLFPTGSDRTELNSA
jgi:integrase